MYSLTDGLIQKSLERMDDDILNSKNVDKSLYPQTLVYGFEVGSSVGFGDILEIAGSLGVELHFSRQEH
jgi:hypothetical protein